MNAWTITGTGRERRRTASGHRSSWGEAQGDPSPESDGLRPRAARPGRPGLAPVRSVGAAGPPGRSRSGNSPRRAVARGSGDATAPAESPGDDRRRPAVPAAPRRALTTALMRTAALPWQTRGRCPHRRGGAAGTVVGQGGSRAVSTSAQPHRCVGPAVSAGFLIREIFAALASAAPVSRQLRSVVGPPPSPAMSSAALRLAWSWRPTA